MSVLRAELASWVERARVGEEIVVADRGLPVARLLSIGSTPLLEQLTAQGVLSKPRSSVARKQSMGRHRLGSPERDGARGTITTLRRNLGNHQPMGRRLGGIEEADHRHPFSSRGRGNRLPWPCLHEFFAVVTNRRAFADATPPATALGVMGDLLGLLGARPLGETYHHLALLKMIWLPRRQA